MKHIEFEKLLEIYERGEVSDEKITAHLRVCPKCAARAAKLKNFLIYSKTDKSEKVGQRVTANLLNIFQPRKKSARRKKSFAEKILAKLVFDDWQIALNERHGFSDSRQLLFKAGDFEIDLRLQLTDDKCRISGQIFPSCEKGSVEIYSEDFRLETETDENCEFVFSPVEQGVYDLRFDLDSHSILIEKISLLT